MTATVIEVLAAPELARRNCRPLTVSATAIRIRWPFDNLSHSTAAAPDAPMTMTTELLRTPLHDWHVAHGGRMVDFAGWSMPVQYTSIAEEHNATRNAVGVFDISHMGRLQFWRTSFGLHFLTRSSRAASPI